MMLMNICAIAQVPKAISYQGVVKDAAGSILQSQTIYVKANILINPFNGNEEYIDYSEYHTVTTSDVGLFTLAIGEGTPIIGTFNGIDWTMGLCFTQIEMDISGNGSFETLGTRQILSVPYALYGKGAHGLPGLPGPQGPQGATGPVGVTGATGADGGPGLQGPVGPSGLSGPPGLPGVNGIDGPLGEGTNCWDTNANFVNEPGEDINGDGQFDSGDCRNPNGIQGEQGPQGATGPQGPEGTAGAQGPVGAQGPKGPQGATGPPGLPSTCVSPWIENGSSISYNEGNIGIGTPNPTVKVDVLGSVCSNGVALSSDVRYKKDIAVLTNALEKIMALQAVRYEFKTEEFSERNFSKEAQIGLIAQEVEAVMPELVLTKADGYKALDYAKIAPYLIEAIKIVKSEIDNDEQKFDKQCLALEQKVEGLKTLAAQQK